MSGWVSEVEGTIVSSYLYVLLYVNLDMRMAKIQASSSACEYALSTYVLESSFSNAAIKNNIKQY